MSCLRTKEATETVNKHVNHLTSTKGTTRDYREREGPWEKERTVEHIAAQMEGNMQQEYFTD